MTSEEDWIKLQQHIPSTLPPVGIFVECKSSDFRGDITFEARRELNKNPTHKKRPWHFIDTFNDKVDPPEFWRMYKKD